MRSFERLPLPIEGKQGASPTPRTRQSTVAWLSACGEVGWPGPASHELHQAALSRNGAPAGHLPVGSLKEGGEREES
jgi:hypothetical protein